MYLVFPGLISRPASAQGFFVSLYGIYVVAQYINTVSIDQELMYSIPYQSFLIFMDLPDGN
jgi:hypothetical protein